MKSALTFSTLAFFLICHDSLVAQVISPPSAKHLANKDSGIEKIKLGEDEPGCKDSSLAPRIPGCSIIQCDNKEADGLEIQVGALPDGTTQKESMDGTAEIIYYLCPARVTLLQIAKLLDGSLSKSGYKTVYFGKDADEFPIVTSLKDNQWVQVSTYMYDDNSAYILTSLKVPAEAQATTDAMADEMAKTGRVVVRGLTFNADQQLTGDFEKTMAEIGAFLVRQPEIHIRIEGHTEASGDSKAANLAASQRQASAVAMWLLEHGVDKSRVSILGHGDSKPMVDGSAPDAKLKNQRIEMVRI